MVKVKIFEVRRGGDTLLGEVVMPVPHVGDRLVYSESYYVIRGIFHHVSNEVLSYSADILVERV